ncbi:MAG: glycosyltransferase [Pseudomonadales bacterium]|nr:glycosyltransferase [Pseudomonadales bacterium]
MPMKENNQPQVPSVALVYDKVNTQYGGAEWVLRALHDLFPKAPLFTSLYAPKNALWASVFKVVPSFLQKLPIKSHKLLLWLFPLAFESLDLSGYDVVISITSGEAKGVLTKPNQVHLSYVLTPPRYLYTHRSEYIDRHRFFSLPLIRSLIHIPLHYLQWWDQAAAYRPDQMIAISKKVQERIHILYARDADLIYPPLPQLPVVSKKTIDTLSQSRWHLCLSRLVGYKRIDLAVKACVANNSTLVIAGEGEEKRKLVQLAGSKAVLRHGSEEVISFVTDHTRTQGSILFLSHVTNRERTALLAAAQSLIMPGLEDFGITALEAATLGTPSILHAESGVSEVLKNQESAIHIHEESVLAVQTALSQLTTINWRSSTLQAQATSCSTKVFTSKMNDYVYDSIIRLKNDSNI